MIGCELPFFTCFIYNISCPGAIGSAAGEGFDQGCSGVADADIEGPLPGYVPLMPINNRRASPARARRKAAALARAKANVPLPR